MTDILSFSFILAALTSPVWLYLIISFISGNVARYHRKLYKRILEENGDGKTKSIHVKHDSSFSCWACQKFCCHWREPQRYGDWIHEGYTPSYHVDPLDSVSWHEFEYSPHPKRQKEEARLKALEVWEVTVDETEVL